MRSECSTHLPICGVQCVFMALNVSFARILVSRLCCLICWIWISPLTAKSNYDAQARIRYYLSNANTHTDKQREREKSTGCWHLKLIFVQHTPRNHSMSYCVLCFRFFKKENATNLRMSRRHVNSNSFNFCCLHLITSQLRLFFKCAIALAAIRMVQAVTS